MILKNVKSYKYARCFAKKSRNSIKKDDLAKRKVIFMSFIYLLFD